MKKEELIQKLREERVEICGYYLADYISEDTSYEISSECDVELRIPEIIGCGNALDYIKKSDPSMLECFSLAEEYGYKACDLNSVKLANLLIKPEFYEKSMSKIRMIIEEE